MTATIGIEFWTLYKRYTVRTKSIFGEQTLDLDLDNYSTADSAKIPGARYANPLGMVRMLQNL